MSNLIEIGSEISRNANCQIFGDCSGRTISRRTGLGLRKGLQLDVSPKVATDIAHVGMGLVFFLLRSDLPKNRTLGRLLTGGLVLSYLNSRTLCI